MSQSQKIPPETICSGVALGEVAAPTGRGVSLSNRLNSIYTEFRDPAHGYYNTSLSQPNRVSRTDGQPMAESDFRRRPLIYAVEALGLRQPIRFRRVRE